MGIGRAAALSVLSGLVLAAAFPKLGLGPLAWVALVPLLCGVRGCQPGRVFILSALTGTTFYGATLWWIAPTLGNYTTISFPVAGALALLVAFVCSYHFVGFALVLERLAKGGIHRAIAAPAVWVVFEWTRTFAFGGFPWASLGYSQGRAFHLIQIADLGGVYAVSALVVFVNVAFAEIVTDRASVRRVLPWALAVPALAMGYGAARLATIDAAPVEGAIDVAYVQANIGQADKWDRAKQNEILLSHLKLSRRAAQAGAQLVVWPEASIPFDLAADSRVENLADFAGEQGVFVLAGAPGVDIDSDGQEALFNQAWLLTPRRLVLGPYAKMQLVPFGEYVPFGGLFGLVDIVAEAPSEFGRGQNAFVFGGPPLRPIGAAASLQHAPEDAAKGRAARFGTLICYEGIFPALARRFAIGGADFLVNISNDAWYGDTAAPYQHLGMTVFRAIENRLPVVRATNTGVSAFIDARGAEGVRSALFEPDMGIQRVLVRSIDSPYRSFGDVFVYLCLFVTLAFVVRVGLLERRLRSAGGRN